MERVISYIPQYKTVSFLFVLFCVFLMTGNRNEELGDIQRYREFLFLWLVWEKGSGY